MGAAGRRRGTAGRRRRDRRTGPACRPAAARRGSARLAVTSASHPRERLDQAYQLRRVEPSGDADLHPGRELHLERRGRQGPLPYRPRPHHHRHDAGIGGVDDHSHLIEPPHADPLTLRERDHPEATRTPEGPLLGSQRLLPVGQAPGEGLLPPARGRRGSSARPAGRGGSQKSGWIKQCVPDLRRDRA